MRMPEHLRGRVTPAMEDYLRTIYLLQQDHAQATTSLLAERLGFRPASITGMLKTLADLKLVAYTPYHGVTLTPVGERIALEVVRHHRLIELYLVQALGYSWDEVHDEADALEHVMSEKLEARIAAYLGHPTVDPHGDPIPSLDGVVPPSEGVSLADLVVGTPGQIARVRGDEDAARLQYLAGLGLIPGARVEVTARAPFEGPISVRVGDTIHPLDRRMARLILVVAA